MDLQRVKAELTSGATIACTVEDARIRWRSYFKGPVLGYDRQSGESFVLFQPAVSINWIKGMVAWRALPLAWYGDERRAHRA